jgi:hypothetical protein
VLVAAHPGDARRLTIRRDGTRIVVECWLFSTALEKGVLLRSRVLAAVGSAADATRWAGDLAAKFAASPPMLRSRSEARAGVGEFCDSRTIQDSSKSLP